MRLRQGLLSILRDLLPEVRRGAKSLFGPNLWEDEVIKAAYTSVIARLKDARSIVTVLNHRMQLDSTDSLGLSVMGVHEPVETEFVIQEVARGDVVLDVGAHIGYYTLILAREVGEEGRVFAFEPDPANFKLLCKNVELNGYQNVETVQKAVWDTTGELRLYLADENLGDHKTYDSGEERPSIVVEATSLDDYFRDFGAQIDFMKLDVQGAEGYAISGAEKLLSRNRGIKLVTEFTPMALEQAGTSPMAFLELLVAHDFLINEISEARMTITAVRPEEVLAKYPSDRRGFTNLYCAREGP